MQSVHEPPPYMQPFRISLTAAKLDCLASWLSTENRCELSSFRKCCSGLQLTFDISELVLEQDDFVVLGQS